MVTTKRRKVPAQKRICRGEEKITIS